jgi:hypothetical protein
MDACAVCCDGERKARAHGIAISPEWLPCPSCGGALQPWWYDGCYMEPEPVGPIERMRLKWADLVAGLRYWWC